MSIFQERSTLWLPEETSFMKKTIGKYWPFLMKTKSYIFGIGIPKNEYKLSFAKGKVDYTQFKKSIKTTRNITDRRAV